VTGLGISSHGNGQYKPDDIQMAVNRLESKYLDVLVLKFILEKSEKEISDILEIHENTVISLESRAVEIIKSHLNN